MTPQRWQQITELFEQALAQPPAARAEFLERACAGTEGLRGEVLKLLAADGAAAGFLEQPALNEVAETIVGALPMLAAGTQMGCYQISKLLGAGGMGEVYLARDTKLKRLVALKVLSPALAGNAAYLRRFTHEAHAVSLLNHPNILTIYEIGAEAGVQFIATEYVDGATLRRVLAEGGVDLAKTLEIGVQLGYALASAHEAGLVHRDLKPENIMLRRDGIVKILDFGLAKTVPVPGAAIDHEAATQSMFETAPGVVLGTVAYMSPEQARGQALDARTDIWSCGAVLYELATGHSPFAQATTADTIAAVLHQEPEPLRNYAPGTPAELQRIVSRALTKKRDERYAAAEELLTELKGLRAELAFAQRNNSNPPPATRPTGESRAQASAPEALPRLTGRVSGWAAQLSTWRRGLSVLLAALALTGLVFAYRWYFRPAPTLTEQDTILLADFSNTTDEPIFDGMLKQGLVLALAQSPFLQIFQDDEVRESLRLMNRPPDEPVTLETGREICLRHGLKVLIKGALGRVGNKYALTLEVVQAVDGKVIAQARTEAPHKGEVLQALGQAAHELRPKLGESLSSVQQFDIPLPQTTTSSLEAFKAMSLAHELENRGLLTEATSLYQRAIAIDPNFAYAYAALGALSANLNQPQLAAGYATKAYQLRERVSNFC